jgi:hypothetical protein
MESGDPRALEAENNVYRQVVYLTDQSSGSDRVGRSLGFRIVFMLVYHINNILWEHV